LGTLVINTLKFLLVGWIGTQFSYGFNNPQSPFLYAYLGALIVSVVSVILSRFLVHKS
jgi:uncharacterized membrane protein YvlD (DUF360 family)